MEPIFSMRMGPTPVEVHKHWGEELPQDAPKQYDVKFGGHVVGSFWTQRDEAGTWKITRIAESEPIHRDIIKRVANAALDAGALGVVK